MFELTEEEEAYSLTRGQVSRDVLDRAIALGYERSDYLGVEDRNDDYFDEAAQVVISCLADALFDAVRFFGNSSWRADARLTALRAFFPSYTAGEFPETQDFDGKFANRPLCSRHDHDF